MTGHACTPQPQMVLGTRCNACDRPLIVAGCPLCVTCCNETPLDICGRCGKGDSGDHDWDCLDGVRP